MEPKSLIQIISEREFLKIIQEPFEFFFMISNDFEKDLSAMMIATIFVHNEEEYMALKNSGRTDLISNEDLVIELHRYYTDIGFIKTLDHYQNNFVQNQILPYMAVAPGPGGGHILRTKSLGLPLWLSGLL